MPRRSRCVLAGVPHHITQRGVDKCVTFSTEEDRHTYLQLLRANLSDAKVRLRASLAHSGAVALAQVPAPSYFEILLEVGREQGIALGIVFDESRILSETTNNLPQKRTIAGIVKLISGYTCQQEDGV